MAEDKTSSDATFAGSVPDVYEEYLVPLIFEDYADDLVARLQGIASGTVLEIAAGTGVVTRRLATGLGASVEIVGSDLNEAMLDRAATTGTSRQVTWRQANAEALPFEASHFDAVVCQFGVMFFPDKAKAFAEAHRVLASEGILLFNVWDRIDTNEFADAITNAVAALFPDDPPLFLPRTPHGYYDEAQIRADLTEAGFTHIEFEAMEARSRATGPRDPAIAYCHGTPLRDEIEARDPAGLSRATDAATDAIAERFGATDPDGLIRGFVVTASSSLNV